MKALRSPELRLPVLTLLLLLLPGLTAASAGCPAPNPSLDDDAGVAAADGAVDASDARSDARAESDAAAPVKSDSCAEGAITSPCACGTAIESDGACCTGVFQSVPCGQPRTYYVSLAGDDANSGLSAASSWRSLAKVNAAALTPGSAVLFKRGDAWFGRLHPKSGDATGTVTYGAYGAGDKPLLHLAVSLGNQADWIEVRSHVWKDNDRLIAAGAAVDVGNIVIDDSFAGRKRWEQSTLMNQDDFWYEPTNHVYMYSVGNPAAVHHDIKAALSASIIGADSTYIAYRDLALKYTGGYGISGVSNHITASHLDIAWVGGMEATRPVREGNGIEFWGDAHDNLVEYCRVWEIYDAALSNQYGGTAAAQTNIVYRHNIIWNSEYSFEYFNEPNAQSQTSNIVFENNTCLHAGGGWGHAQRPDPSGYHVRMARTPPNTTGVRIANNIFDEATSATYRIYGFEGVFAATAIDYNVIRQQSGVVARDYASFAAFKTQTGWEAHAQVTDPLLVDPTHLDFTLAASSPCIDSGDPTTPHDPDGTRADIGAIFHDQR
jgi:hypothetical protein